jgi:hypothetical protein
MDIIEAISLAFQDVFEPEYGAIPQPGHTLWLDGRSHPRSEEENWIRAEFEFPGHNERSAHEPVVQSIPWC